MAARTRIVVNPAAADREVRLSPTRSRVTVFGAGRGAREPRVDHDGPLALTVLRGRMAITRDGELSVVEAGETVVVAPGVSHAWWSTRAGELCLEIASAPGQPDGQECVATGRTRPWRSWSWSSPAPTGWAPSALR